MAAPPVPSEAQIARHGTMATTDRMKIYILVAYFRFWQTDKVAARSLLAYARYQVYVAVGLLFCEQTQRQTRMRS